jgi:ribose-phosphate pyrophosphokinase
MLIADALDRIPQVTKKLLYLPFVPYARQDHIVAPGESLSLAVFARMINSCGFDRVAVFDPHSDVAPALIAKVTVVSNLALVKKVLEGKTDYWILSPDAGAYKKIGKIADEIGYSREIIMCGKVRDPRPENKGKILRMQVPEMDYLGQDVYILDDIIEGGRTFIGIAQELRKRNAGKIYLIISHPVLSFGDAEVQKYLDGIFTTDSFVPVGTFDPNFVKVTPLCDIIS